MILLDKAPNNYFLMHSCIYLKEKNIFKHSLANSLGTQRNNKCSIAQQTCYKSSFCEGLVSLILFGGRLFIIMVIEAVICGVFQLYLGAKENTNAVSINVIITFLLVEF